MVVAICGSSVYHFLCKRYNVVNYTAASYTLQQRLTIRTYFDTLYGLRN